MILVAEDNLLLQDLLKLQLDSLGYESTIVSNGKEAINLIKNESFQIVLTDCQMPVMDGFQLLREIRVLEQGSNKGIPVIAITADPNDAKKQLGDNEYFDDYIKKPFNPDSLSSALKKYI